MSLDDLLYGADMLPDKPDNLASETIRCSLCDVRFVPVQYKEKKCSTCRNEKALESYNNDK